MNVAAADLGLPSDLDLLDDCEAAYQGPWDWESGHVRAIRRQRGIYTVAAFQGTTRDGISILRDIRFMPWWHRRVGFCPAGFLKGVVNIMDEMERDLAAAARAGTLIITGHSLGAAEAEICAGWWCALGCPPAKLLSVAPPRSGGLKLATLLKMIPEAKALHCGDDPVPDVPWLYSHPLPLTKIGAPSWDPLWCHRLATYRSAMKCAD